MPQNFLSEGTLEGISFSPEQRQHYRERLLEALQAARNYDGSEASFRAIMEKNIALEEWMRSVHGREEGRTTDEEERSFSKAAGTKREHTISSILDLAARKLRELIEKPQTIEEVLQILHIVYTTIGAVLLPPGSQEVPRADGSGQRMPAEREPRVQALLQALQEYNIFTDDLIATTGIVLSSMIRQESYVLIEIPRIGREVLLCNQVGEATFVSYRHLSLQTYLTRTKEELSLMEGVTRITSRGLGEWEQDVLRVLLKDVSPEDMRKVDVRDIETIRGEVKERYRTGKEWVEMSRKAKQSFKLAGRGEGALATALGLSLERSPCDSPYAHALLGAEIYGKDDPDIVIALAQEEEWQKLGQDPELLKGEVKERYRTGKEWVEMSLKAKQSFKLAGRGERALATALGLSLERSPCDSPYAHALLGAEIYGGGDPDIAAALARFSGDGGETALP